MRWGKLILVLTLTGGIVAFNLGFKNLLVKRLIESTLQSIFQAKAEVKGVRFELFGPRIRWDHLEVANGDAPMFNLFELGKTEFKMNGEELLKGKVVIENLECQGIAWNTPRLKSGALPYLKKKTETKKEEAKPEGPGLMDIAKINAEELLAKHLPELKTLATLSNAAKEFTAFTGKWEKTVQDTGKNVDNLNTDFQKIKAINVPAIKTVDAAQKTLADIQRFNDSLKSVKQNVDTIKNDSAADFNKVKTVALETKGSVEKDLKYLKGLINIPQGGAKGMVKTMLQKTLSDKLGMTYFYAMKALDYAQALNQSSPKDAKKQKQMIKSASLRRPGYDVYFPGSGYPKFLLQHLGTSISNAAENKYLLVDVKDISSDPNLWNHPITWLFDRNNQGMGLRISGLIDTRTNSNDSFKMDLDLTSIPFQIGTELSFMNIQAAAGKYNVGLGLDLKKDKANAGSLKLVLQDMKWTKGDKPNTVSDILYDILADSPTLDFDIKYQVIMPAGTLDLQVASSLDDVIQKKIGKFIDDMVKQAEAKLKSELDRITAPLVKQKDQLLAKVDGVQNSLTASTRKVDEYQKEIDKKKAEVNARIEAIKKEAAGKVTDTIKKNVTIPKF